MDKGYKIKNAEGLYSTGGHDPIFTNQGKFWKSRRAVLLHLALFKNFRKVYQNCMIEEYTIQLHHWDMLADWSAPIEAEAERAKKKVRENAEAKQRDIQRKLDEIERLKAELRTAKGAL